MMGLMGGGDAGTAGATAGCSYALLADGTTITIRPARPDDHAAVRQLHEAMSPDNLYLRFFSLSKQSGRQEASRLTRAEDGRHAALLGFLGAELVGVASYEQPASDLSTAEVAFAVADRMHGRGVATLLLEHLVSLARACGVRVLTASALAENTAMLRVFADAGLSVQRRVADGVVELTMPVPRSAGLSEPSRYLDAVAGREQRAEVASLEPLLHPRTVAVIGAGRRGGSIGRVIVRNIRDAGYPGALFAVHPRLTDIDGIPCVPAPAALPQAPDLAVLAVPAAGLLAAAEDCGQRGARSLVVITSGLTPAQSARLLDTCRRWGMRLVGPNCFGVAVPPAGLDATFARHHPAPGTAGLVVQSGGLGVALLEHFSRLGIGVSSFASVGDKLDVSGNDMLQWWADDGVTRLAVLYLESFGNPRKFARTAARVSARMPVLTVHAGTSAPGLRAVTTHTAAAAAPLITRQALFEQAGIIATSNLGELLDTAVLLAAQPVPAGSRVAVLTNVGGAAVLAADACVAAGLSVATPGHAVQAKLAAILPPGAAVGGPVDTTATVSADAFGAALATVGGDAGVDAVMALVVRTAAADLVPALTAARLPVPLAAVRLDQPDSVRLLPGADGGAAVPAYAYPESAARALGRAARYGSWRSRPAEPVPDIAGLREAEARQLIASFLDRMPGGGWLPTAETGQLLRCYQLPLAERFGERRPGLPVQPMIAEGTGIIIGVVQEPVFGPLVVFGLGGETSQLLDDHAARLAPLTPADADDLIHSIRAAPVLLGGGPQAGRPMAGLAALRDSLLRVSRLADDLPQVAELTLDPVRCHPGGVTVVDARVRVTSHAAADPFLRQLPAAREPAVG